MFEEDQVSLAGEEAKFSDVVPTTTTEIPNEEFVFTPAPFYLLDYFSKFDEMIEKAKNGNLEIEELSSLKANLIRYSSENNALNYKKFDQLFDIVLSKAYPKDADSIDDCNQHDIDLLLEIDKNMYFRRNILNKAVFVGDIETVKILLASGAVNVNTGSWFTSKVKYNQELSLGLDHFFDEISPIKFNQESDSKYSLALAISRGHIHIVKILLEHNDIDVNIYDKSYPLQIACANRQLDIVQLLINRPDTKLPDYIGGMPFLLWAYVYGNDEIIQALITRGEDRCVIYTVERPRFSFDSYYRQSYNVVSVLLEKILDLDSNTDLLFNAIKRAVNFGCGIYRYCINDLTIYLEPLRGFLQDHIYHLDEITNSICGSSLQNMSFETLNAYQKYKNDVRYLVEQRIAIRDAIILYEKLDSLIEASSVDSLDVRFTTGALILRSRDIIDRNISPFLTPYDVAKLDQLIVRQKRIR